MVDILVTDFEPLFADALSRVLQVDLHSKVVTWDLKDGPPQIKGPPPKLITIDPHSPGESFHAEYIEELRSEWAECRVVVITSVTAANSIASSLRLGARGYLLKSEPIETIRAGVDFVRSGGLAFSLPAASLLSMEIAPTTCLPSASAVHEKQLSPREFQVIQLVAKGHVDSDIARQLGISLRTAQRHVTNILNKLGCRTRSEAVARAIGGAQGLVRNLRADPAQE